MVNNKVFGKIIDANSIVVDIGEGKTDNYIGGTGIALWS
jgi:hypothetical protein